ncbi:MAG: O-antigen ligase family protein [Chitinophagaceae bacterium]
MRNLILIRDSIENKISYYHLAAFLITLPFDRLYTELTLFSFFIHIIIHINPKKFRTAFTRRQLIISSVWFVTLLGLIYSSYKKQGLEDLVRQSAILLFPFFLSLSGFPLSQYRKKLLQILGLTCVVIILFLFADALFAIYHYKLLLSTLFTFPFLNHNFSAPIGIHATYLSLYVSLSLIFFMYSFFEEKDNKKRAMHVIAMLILLAGLMQLASRSVLIATIFIFLIAFPLFLPKGRLRVRFISAVLLIAVLAFTGILTMDSFKRRYITEFKDDLTEVSFNNEQLEPRVNRWKFVMDLALQKPLIGYGSGSEKVLLKDIYFENKYFNSYLHGLNAHNQYLSFWLKTGIWGLAIFLFTLAYGLNMSWVKRDILFAGFMILICITCFSENIFDVNKGIFFYAFFFSLFAWRDYSFKKNNPE